MGAHCHPKRSKRPVLLSPWRKYFFLRVPRLSASSLVIPASFFVLLFVFAPPAHATVRYFISLASRSSNHFQVHLEIPEVDGALELDMPTWNALYQIRDFASRIEELHASTPAGDAVTLTRLTPRSWRAGPVSGTLVLDYSILWDEPSPFSSDVNDQHAFINPATVLLYPAARRAEDVSLEFTAIPTEWHIATALDPGPAPTTFIAANYDALAQGPIEIGTFDEFTIRVADRPIRVVTHLGSIQGELPSAWSREHLEDVARRIVQTETALMGDAPFPRYVFLLHLGVGGGGGMEHPNSTAISVSRGEDPASIMAHELFHAWNVLRIRPQSLEPVDYTREQITDALWFAEGVTSTIGAYTMLRSGLWTRDRFYADLAAQVEELESRPARRFQSVEDASISAWLEKYPYYRGADSSISYYNKGQLLGVCLDILLRDATDNRQSLDTLLRAMNERYAHQRKPYADTAAIQSLASELAGRDLSDFFRRYVAGTDEVPFQEIFARGGLTLELADRVVPDAGFQATRSSTSVVITDVAPGGPADRAGLLPGDTVLDINGQQVRSVPGRWLSSLSPGQQLRVRVRRAGETREFSFPLASRSIRANHIYESSVSGLPRAIREGLLTGTNPAP